MKRIKIAKIIEAVSELAIEANTVLRKDVLAALKKALKSETNSRARRILEMIIQNAQLARDEKMPICQDTGMVVVFVEIGQEVHLTGGSFEQAINKGVSKGYRQGYFRRSIVKDPLKRKGPTDSVPAIIQIKYVTGKNLRLTLMPKGFGSENVTRLLMLSPNDDSRAIKKAVIDLVKEKGSNACPPLVVGIGLGGTADKALELSKQALIRPIDRRNRQTHFARLEREILGELNRLDIGPMGLGGKTTTLGVNIASYPTHIAGLPLAINLSCHALRSATKVI